MKNLLTYILAFTQCSVLVNCKNSKKPSSVARHILADTVINKTEKSKVSFDKIDTLPEISKAFIVNGIKCYWEYSFFIGKEDEIGGSVLKLKNYQTKKTMLVDHDVRERDYFSGIKKYGLDGNFSFSDINFDGFKDFSIYNKEGSGTGGDLYNVYLFNRNKNIFEYSKALSGGNPEVDYKNKTLTTFWKMGTGWNSSQVYHFGKNGRIKFTEIITEEVFSKDTTQILITTYEKINNGKVIKKQIDTTKFEGW